MTYMICQYPYHIYRLVRIYHPSIESHLSSLNLLYVLDIPLIILRLINRTINPWLSYFLMNSIRESSEGICSSFWLCNCFPCCPNRWSYLNDCSLCIRNEWYDLTANHQTVREIRPTGKVLKKEYFDSTGKRIRQTYEEYIRYYRRPSGRINDVNPALLLAGRNRLSIDETAKNHNQPRTVL